MALLDPDDRRDHDIRLRLSAREYLIVLRALKLRNSPSLAAGVRDMVLERAAQTQAKPAPAENEEARQSLPQTNNANKGEVATWTKKKWRCRLMRNAARWWRQKPAGAGSRSMRP